MGNPFELKFTLEQHTPMIHFQHDQEGATLRASEVKPKLDRFLIEKITGRRGDEAVQRMKFNEVYRQWFRGSENQNSLGYKLIIGAMSDSDKYVSRKLSIDSGRKRPEQFPMFFGDMGDKGISAHFVFHPKVLVTICANTISLKNEIEKHINDFFMNHNFGMRQSKGFGSFLPELIDDSQHQLKYYFDVNLSEIRIKQFENALSLPFQHFYKLFHTISLFYSTLRSGINQGWGPAPMYFKSMLFMYAKERMSAQWEKREIKSQFYNYTLSSQQHVYRRSDPLNYTSKQVFLIRDMLGLASRSDWLSEKDIISVLSKDIGRFASPLLFKPVRIDHNSFRIYFKGDQEAIDNMANRIFTITSRNKNRSFDLKTPPKGAFIFDDFIKFAVSKDLEQHIELKSGSGFSSDKRLLIDIYKQIERKL